MKYEGLSEELVKRLENLPPDEPRSKLEPLRELILAWRQQGRSYRRIQQLLREKCKVDVAYETLRRFVQRRQRPDWPEYAVETETVPSPVTPVSTASMRPLRRGPRTNSQVQSRASARPRTRSNGFLSTTPTNR